MAQVADELEPDWTPTAVAAVMNVHPVTIARWVREGRIQGYRVGQTVRIPAQEVERIRTTPGTRSASRLPVDERSRAGNLAAVRC